MPLQNNKIILDCDFIVSYNLKWIDAIEKFYLKDPDMQKVYLRYIISKYGIKKGEMLLSDYNNQIKNESIH